MKKIFFPAMVCMAMVSCGDNAEVVKTEGTEVAAEPSFVSPIEYSSKFELGDSKKSEQIVQLWKDFDDNKLDANSSYFADTVSMDFPGMSFKGTRDSLVAMTKGYRSSMGGVVSKIDAVMSVKSTDKMEDWVLIWGREYITSAKGKVDSSGLHEIWRFNSAGKVDYMGQFRQEYPMPKK